MNGALLAVAELEPAHRGRELQKALVGLRRTLPLTPKFEDHVAQAEDVVAAEHAEVPHLPPPLAFEVVDELLRVAHLVFS